MAAKPSRSRPGRRLFGRGADYVALGLIAVAAIALAALALSGFSLRPGINLSPTSRPASTVFDLPAETPTPTPTPEAPISVSLLTDQPSAAADSWWASSVAASLVPGVVAGGDFAPTATVDSALTVSELEARVAAVPSLSGFVVVHAGAGDLDVGTAPAAVATEVQGLWQAVAAKGGTPIVTLVSPSNENGAETVELNGLLQTDAAAAGFGVLDLYSPVAASNGSWSPTFSADGVLPNAAGSQALAQAVVSQLPQLVVTK
ncbi:SGNH/GDSL hydrolase family protein [Agreia bicolorata]|uniref:SGNH hydrolase-type esterase domain-containing protein n=1 Tax=Agreia bicolorata TaxID=110935 RepID=A0ABR5CDK4_9MICO|nr:SGNH/GDSL hydrolase family protein [Agreia bicolorata]KJC63677.1 hypothetical protein TZ00_14340 [Agreia bicolorata]